MATLDLPDVPISAWEDYTAQRFKDFTQPALDRLSMAPNPAIETIRSQVDPANRLYVDAAVGAAQKAGIDPATYVRQIFAESGFNPNAGSNEGAKGISQFTDATAKGYGIDPYNPGQALDAGARYMATALATNHGDYRLALASYNAGQGNVDRYGQNIFNPAYLKAQGWSDEDANQPAHYIASILGGGATPVTTPTPASLVQGAGAALGAAAGQVAQVPQQAVQSFKDYSAGLLHQFSQSLVPPQPASNTGADTTRPSDLPTPPDAPQAPDLGGSSFHDWSNNLIGQLAQTSSVLPAALSSPGAAVAGAAGGDVAASSPALSSPSPGYNDMVGASSTPPPPMPTPAATGGTPPSTPAPSFADWSTNLINQLGQRLGAGAVSPNAGPSPTPSSGPSYNDMVGARSNGQGAGPPSLTSLDNAQPGIQAPGTTGLPLAAMPGQIGQALGNVANQVGTAAQNELVRESQSPDVTSPGALAAKGILGVGQMAAANRAEMERAYNLPPGPEREAALNQLALNAVLSTGGAGEIGNAVEGAAGKVAAPLAEDAGQAVGNLARDVIGKAPPTVSDAPSFAVPGAEGTAAQQAALRPTDAGDAANIQLNKFGPATQPLIGQAAAENANFAGARRGVISDADALANAAQTAQATPVEKWLAIKPGTALNQEQNIALGQTLQKFGQDFDAQTAAIQKAKADGTATPLMLAEQAQKALQFGQLTAIRAGATSEAGRALRSFQTILTGANASAATQEEAITKAFKALGTSPEKFQDWMTAWSMTPPDNAAARVKLLQSLTQPTLMDKALTFGISNMLSSTKTGEIIGMHGAIMALNRPLLTVIRGDPLDAVANVVGQTRSIGSAWSNAVEALKTGVGPTTAAATLRGGNLEVRPDAFPGTAGLVVTPTLRAINAMHEFFRTTATAGALAEAARREALTSGRAVADLLANPTPKMLKFADDIAEQALHGGTPSAPAQLILNARNLVHTDLTGANLNAQNVGKVATGLTANLLLPFVKIPDYLYRNGAKIATGPLYYGATTATHALRGETSQALSDARMWGVVSLLWGGILGEAIAGNVTGSGPTDPTKLALLKEARDPATGQPAWQAHSTRIPVPGGYRWVDNNVFGPLAVPLNALASAVEAYRLDGIKPAATPTDFMLSVANNTAKSMLDASYIRTAGQFFSAAMQGQAASAIAKTTGANIASRFIPFVSAGAEVARGMDPGVKAPSGPLQQIEARLPVLSRNIPNQVSPYGQPLQNQQDLVSTLSPAITSTAGPVNQAANEVARLNQSGQAVNVRVLPSTQQKGGGTYEGSPQTAEQIRTVQTTLGQNAQRYIAAEMGRPGYQALSDAEKAKTLNRALATADQQANQTAASSLNLDDKHKAALAWTQVPHFAGVSGTPAQVADRNLAIAKAKTTLSEYAKKYGSQQMGMYHLLRDNRATLNLALTPVLPASYLVYRKQAIDKKYGGALTQAAQEGLLDASQVLPVGSGG